jgi:hypothetical protein
VRSRADLVVALGLGLATLVLVAATIPDYGLTWDEPYYFHAADLHAGWLGRLGGELTRGGPVGSLAPAAIEAAWRWDPSHVPHPPFSRIPAGLARALLSPPLDRFVAYRLPTAVLFALVVATAYGWTAAVFGRAAGLLTALLTLSTPALFAHAHFLMTDMPLTVLWWLTAYAFWRGLESWRWSVAAGMLWGLGLATKFPAILIPLPLLVWAHLYRRREYHNNVLALLLVAPVAMVAVNPHLWHQPMARFFQFLAESAGRTGRPGTDFLVFFLGEYHRSATLPWYYAGLMMAATIPESTLALALLGGVTRMGRPRHEVRALFAANAIAIVGVGLVPGATLHDVTRLLLPALPFVTALAGCGLGRLSELAGAGLAPWAARHGIRHARVKLAAAVGALALTVPVLDLILYHPYQLSYFNRLVGGVRGAHARGLEVTAMMEAFTPRFLGFLNAEIPRDAVLNASFANFMFMYYQKQGKLRPDIRLSDRPDYDYYLLLNRPSAYRRDPRLPVRDPALYLDDLALVRSRPVLCRVVDLHGVPLIFLFGRGERGCGGLGTDRGLRSGRGARALAQLGPAHRAEVAPAADPELLGPLEVVQHREVRRRIAQPRLHAADREPEPRPDGVDPRVAPRVRRDHPLAQVHLEEIDAVGRHVQDVVGVEGVAAELDRGLLGVGAPRLPVHQREPVGGRPVAEVRRGVDRRPLEIERAHVLDQDPPLAGRLADLGQELEPVEVLEAAQHVVAEGLPGAGRDLQLVLVLEQGHVRLGALAVPAVPRGAPLLAHPADGLLDDPRLGERTPGVERLEGHLDRLVDDPPRPALAAGELLQDVEAPDLGGGPRLPPAPAPVVVVEVLPAAVLEHGVPGA